jgi:hypothetical protein
MWPTIRAELLTTDGSIDHALLSYSSQGRRQQDDPELFRRKRQSGSAGAQELHISAKLHTGAL